MNRKDIKYYALIGTLKALALLPLRALYALSDLACFILHRVVGYRVAVVRKNLRACFPHMPEKELRDIENRFYRYLCDCFVEAVKLLHISNRQLSRRVELRNMEVLKDLTAEGRTVILFLGHYGNWEWVPTLSLGMPDNVMLGQLYKPLHNKLMNRVMLRIRSRFRSICIPTKTAYRQLLEARREGKIFVVGFIADQRPLGKPLNHWTQFMGQPTAFMAGGETIGDRIGAAYVYAEMMPLRRGRYCLSFHKMNLEETDDKEFPYTRMFFSMLEQSIRHNPPFWLWSHNRWKSVPPENINI